MRDRVDRDLLLFGHAWTRPTSMEIGAERYYLVFKDRESSRTDRRLYEALQLLSSRPRCVTIPLPGPRGEFRPAVAGQR
jgi:hypothetical protein